MASAPPESTAHRRDLPAERSTRPHGPARPGTAIPSQHHGHRVGPRRRDLHRPLVDGYRRWLDRQQQRVTADAEIGRYVDVANDALDAAGQVADRLERAVTLLRVDARAREAFRFANQAMARQRVRSELVRRR